MSDNESPAEVLREAAALMRSRADLPYVSGAWQAVGIHIHKTSRSSRIFYPAHAKADAALFDSDDEQVTNEAIAEHVASWHPAIALAVADWLDEAVEHLEQRAVDLAEHDAATCPTAREGLECSVMGQALTVARAYLGGRP